ncbi:hypothetical protein TNCV_3086191 [Trichonephila clavipes]|nr:hypothetical protein TNCV_3086191 [Trichonephila clavipes]
MQNAYVETSVYGAPFKDKFQRSNALDIKETLKSGLPFRAEPRFDTIELLIVPKIEGDFERSTFFNGCRSSSSQVQMDTQPARIFLHLRNEEMDRIIEKIIAVNGDYVEK